VILDQLVRPFGFFLGMSLTDSVFLVPTSSAPSANGCVDAAADVETIEKLLAAVDRLRSERDELRRQLEFLQVESKFTIEALESKINSGATLTTVATTDEDPRVSQLEGEVQELLERLARRETLPSSAIDSSRLGLITSASLVMVGHLQTQIDHDAELNDQARVEILDVKHHRDDILQQRDVLHLQVEHLQSQVVANTRIREQWQELQSDLAGKAARLSDITRALEDAESERNSLKVEMVNLQDDVTLAQRELKQAEQRYSDLQNQQLSAMSSTQVNRKLKEQIEELEGRVARRTEQIGIHQHDIKRLETNLKLQEDRIAEMTSELEVAMLEKKSMIEDCADAREARDRALKKADDLEEAVETLETQLQSSEKQREVEVTSLVKIWCSVLTQSRSSASRLRSVTYQMGAANADAVQRLQQVSAEHNYATAVLNKQASELELTHQAAITHREEIRDAVVALAVVQTTNAESRRTMLHNRDRICALLTDTRNELNDRFEEINSLQDQLRRLRSQGDEQPTEQQSAHSVEVIKLQQANADLDRSRAELVGQLGQSREELCLAIEQRDQLRTDSDAVRAQITQLQSDHTEELESLRGKLQQVAVDLQEVREAYAAAEKARRDLSTTNAELESSLENISQQRETDYELIAELQTREAGHTKQVLGLQTRLDKCAEELQQTSREKSELEILLQQTKTELSHANDTTEDRVSRLLEERDALQESLDEVQSRHAKEIDQVQGRLRDLEAESESLRAQLDKAITDQKRVRASFEAELRKSAERYEASTVELDGVKTQLSVLEAEFDGVDSQLQNALEERGALEEKNTNLESDIQRAFSMQRYLESQLKDR
jgi:chromosome segregation ATPase